jgi:gamma-glutamyl hydrolase
MLKVALLLATAASSLVIPPQINNLPTIGVLSVPQADATACATLASSNSTGVSCFTAFYFHWVQSVGARAIILPVDAPLAVLDSLLDSVNGVLFTGGSLENLTFDSPYMVTAAHVFKRVLEKNDAGTYFPLHGTCQGFQVLSLLVSQDQSVLAYNAFDSEGLVIPLDISWDGHHSSRIFSAITAPDAVVNTLGSLNSTINLHHDGVPVSTFEANQNLTDFFVLVSTNFDRVGKAFVSTVEAWDYPITATQWHPERNAGEWRDTIASSAHSAEAIDAMLYMASYFVGGARRNAQGFADTALFSKYSVFSYPLVGSSDAGSSGYQWVVFSE